MMLGSQCSPCCGGACQNFQSIAAEWNASSSILEWSFSSTGFNAIPSFSTQDQEAYYTSSVPTFSRPGFYRSIQQGNAKAEFMFAVTSSVANVWTARYRLQDTTVANSSVTEDMVFECTNGTTQVGKSYFGNLSSAIRVDDQNYSCCCVQYGQTVLFEPNGRANACSTSTSTTNANCDTAVNSAGQTKGICTRTANPFGGFFQSYTSYGYTMSLTLFDWRLFRTNPLP